MDDHSYFLAEGDDADQVEVGMQDLIQWVAGRGPAQFGWKIANVLNDGDINFWLNNPTAGISLQPSFPTSSFMNAAPPPLLLSGKKISLYLKIMTKKAWYHINNNIHNSTIHHRQSFAAIDSDFQLYGAAATAASRGREEPTSQSVVWSLYLGRSCVGSVKRTVITFASSYFILLLKTMHRLNNRRIIVTLEHFNFSPEVDTFHQNFVTFNRKSIGSPRLKHWLTSKTSSAPRIWPRKGWKCQDGWARVYWRSKYIFLILMLNPF